MSMLHIDDRLAGLAEAATRAAMRPTAQPRTHPRRISTPTERELSLSADRALELTGTLLEILATGDTTMLEATCSATVHARTPTSDTTGIDELVESMSTEAPVFTDIDVTIETLIVAGSDVAAEWRLHADHSGQLHVDWAVIEPTHQSITLAGVLIGHVAALEADGPERQVFDDVHVYYDTTSLLVQLGLT